MPFDLVGEDEKTICKQFAEELGLVAVGLQAMFRTYGFGAKTSSGFGLAREAIQGILSMRTKKTSQEFESFEQLVTMAKHWSLT